MNDFLSTAELAKIFKVSPKTVRWNFCTRGHYLSLVPRKLPNRILLWPVADVEKLLTSNEAGSQ